MIILQFTGGYTVYQRKERLRTLISIDRRRAFGGWLWAAGALYALLFIINVSSELLEDWGSAMVLFEYSRNMGHTLWLTPMMAALPFSMSFCADWKSRYYICGVMRAGKRRYVFSKLCCCALSGGAALAAGMAFFIVLLYIRFNPADDFMIEFMEYVNMQQVLEHGAYAQYFAGIVYLQFIAGAFWALSALAFSAWYPNALFTLCFPLFLYRLALEISDLSGAPAWTSLPLLADGMVAMDYWPTLAVATAVFAGLSVICCLVFRLGVYRRLNNG